MYLLISKIKDTPIIVSLIILGIYSSHVHSTDYSFLACIAILGTVLIPMLSSYVTIKQIEYHLVTNGNFYL